MQEWAFRRSLCDEAMGDQCSVQLVVQEFWKVLHTAFDAADQSKRCRIFARVKA